MGAYTEAITAWANSGKEMDQSHWANDLRDLAVSFYRVGWELLNKNARHEAVRVFGLSLEALQAHLQVLPKEKQTREHMKMCNDMHSLIVSAQGKAQRKWFW